MYNTHEVEFQLLVEPNTLTFLGLFQIQIQCTFSLSCNARPYLIDPIHIRSICQLFHDFVRIQSTPYGQSHLSLMTYFAALTRGNLSEKIPA